jgi:hypothetical protein
MGEGQTCTTKRDLDARLSSPRIRKTGLISTFVKIDNSVFTSSMQFSPSVS